MPKILTVNGNLPWVKHSRNLKPNKPCQVDKLDIKQGTDWASSI